MNPVKIRSETVRDSSIQKKENELESAEIPEPVNSLFKPQLFI
jgi:hypothetical protein